MDRPEKEECASKGEPSPTSPTFVSCIKEARGDPTAAPGLPASDLRALAATCIVPMVSIERDPNKRPSWTLCLLTTRKWMYCKDSEALAHAQVRGTLGWPPVMAQHKRCEETSWESARGWLMFGCLTSRGTGIVRRSGGIVDCRCCVDNTYLHPLGRHESLSQWPGTHDAATTVTRMGLRGWTLRLLPLKMAPPKMCTGVGFLSNPAIWVFFRARCVVDSPGPN